MKVSKQALLGSLPHPWPVDFVPEIAARVQADGRKIIVLDDDPTGTQTVANVPVLTGWSPEVLVEVLSEPNPLVYLLTNSRSLEAEQAITLNREIARQLVQASRAAGRDFVVVSRSDSTLRGHYPAEVEALAAGLDRPVDGRLIVPFFNEGGRLTVGDTHYVAEEEWLTPAGETEYARDPAFGYHSSDLKAWVSEKHAGAIPPEAVASISIDTLRLGGPRAVIAALMSLSPGQVCVVNTAETRDLEVFVAGLLAAEAAGKRFVYRTAASFVQVRAGLRPPTRLEAGDLAPYIKGQGGLIVAGSFIQKSTAQIEAVRRLPGMASIEVSVERLLDLQAQRGEIRQAVQAVGRSLEAGQDAILYTSRGLVAGATPAESLRIGGTVSQALVQVVREIDARPAWMVAKGGITSSDVATGGLGLQRAEVLGQIIPGAPVWLTGAGSRWEGLVYGVFPGNVGGPGSLAELVEFLRAV